LVLFVTIGTPASSPNGPLNDGMLGRSRPDARLVREYLGTLDEAACGAASEAKPKFVSRSDPPLTANYRTNRPGISLIIK
jgi:hypothetical protein